MMLIAASRMANLSSFRQRNSVRTFSAFARWRSKRASSEMRMMWRMSATGSATATVRSFSITSATTWIAWWLVWRRTVEAQVYGFVIHSIKLHTVISNRHQSITQVMEAEIRSQPSMAMPLPCSATLYWRWPIFQTTVFTTMHEQSFDLTSKRAVCPHSGDRLE